MMASEGSYPRLVVAISLLSGFTVLNWHKVVKPTGQWLLKTVLGVAFSATAAVAPGAVSAVTGAVLAKEVAVIEKDLLGEGDADALMRIPQGSSKDAILAKARKLKQDTAKDGKVWGGVYHDPTHESELTATQNEIWALFNTSNTLYPTVFPAIRKFEAEVVAMVSDLVHAQQAGGVGLLASGGTESILIAVLAYREQAYARGNRQPEIVAGLSAHPALSKACRYFGVKLVVAPICRDTLRFTAAQAEPYLTRRTVAIYASAPTFSHGVLDDVGSLAALAQRRGLGLHVDNCLGGFLVSYMQKLRDEDFADFPLPGDQPSKLPPCVRHVQEHKWDFEVAGVTSMSVDVHKYGFASKGSSVVLFRDPELRRLSYMPSSEGCEGLYVTPTLQGSRSGANIAQAWATIQQVGDDGYRRMAAGVVQAFERVRAAVAALPELEIAGEPTCAVLPIQLNPKTTSGGMSIYQVASLLEKKGWNLFTGQKPEVMSICLGEQHAHTMPTLIADLTEAVATVRENPNVKLEGTTSVYGAAAMAPTVVLDSVLRSYCDIRMTVKPKAA